MRKYLTTCLLIHVVACTCLADDAPPGDPHITDFAFNTVFSQAPYSDDKLLGIEKGTPKAAVLELLGNPLEIRTIRYLHCMLFSQYQYRLDPTSAEAHGIDSSKVREYEAPFLGVWFTEQGTVSHVFNSGFMPKEESEQLTGQDIATITNRFGSPREELQVEPLEVFCYTKLRDGPYTGHHGGIYVRRVYFDQHEKVAAVESTEGTQFDIYSGIVPKK